MPEEIEPKPEKIIEKQPKVDCLSRIKLHKFKILAGVLGVLVFAGAVFGAYKLGQKQTPLAPRPTPTPVAIATPTSLPSETTVPAFSPTPTIRTINYKIIKGWERYDNTSGGYSVQYDPKLYRAVDKDETNPKIALDDALTLDCITQPPLKTCISRIQILIFSDYKGGSRRQWLLETPTHASYAPLYYEDVQVQGIEALIAMDDHYTWIAVPFSNRMIDIVMDTTFYNPDQQKPVNIEEVYQFLSGFKFLE